MEYRTLGKTGISVSEVGLGCEHLQGKPAETVARVVHAALDGGVNILDAFMSEPQVRSDIGAALRGRRDRVTIQGHIGSVWHDGQYERSRDGEQCRIFVEDFLRRVGTDYIDIGMIHFVDTLDDLKTVEEGPVLDYARRLKEQGVIRAIGMSSHDPVTARRAVEAGWLDVLMFSVNPAYDLLPENTYIDNYFNVDTWRGEGFSGINPNRAALYEACAAHGVGITVMKTYGAGFLFNPGLSPFGRTFTPAQLIHYALSRPAVASALIGCQTPEEVAAALAYENASPEERDYGAVLAATAQFGVTRQCVYCNHCHPCPVGIDVAAVNRCLDTLRTGTDAQDTVRAQYAALEAHAGDCLACGACEERCPFGVGVIGRMREAAELFGI
ncbi:MAG: aldo/keto reductase [Clostridiaceae bacterium]|nr:aldo/keto reductase [Clostridiaceae bacterium]